MKSKFRRRRKVVFDSGVMITIPAESIWLIDISPNKKNYMDPSKQMTDIVGCRFVTLVSSDIEIVERALIGFSGWTVTRERHYADEVAAKPGEFDYQSVHYLAICFQEFTHGGTIIPEGTTCEVQLRSLLQHAYAELVHDNIYKADQYVPQSTKRLVARSMALMEATDEMFCSVARELDDVNRSQRFWYACLDTKFKEITGIGFYSSLDEHTLIILERFRELLRTVSLAEVTRMFEAMAYRTKIAERQDLELFSKPICVLVFWLAKHRFDDLSNDWPLASLDSDVAEIASFVGFSWH
ncbi:GTP pyrophosphokinase [Pigmentiphaga litoralis]|uniref:GTP pyrophosphokinase n=1 Tax=Pigmentiphaga litoralis TaxID=516702 RepID=UPI003B43165C